MTMHIARSCTLALLLTAGVPLQASFCVPPSPAPQQPLPDPPSPACGPGTNSAASGSCTTCDICSKSPGYLASGTYVNTFTDLQIPTAGMYPLSVFRRYDSGHLVDGPLGIGWTSSLTAHLYFATYLFAANTYSYEADVIMPSGLQYRFTMSGNAFVAPPGSFDTLVKNGDGTYSLTLQHTRSVYRFNADGSIASLTDDYGNLISYAYDGSGKLTTISDAAGSGRSITLAWLNGRIQSLTDNSGRIVKYFYDSQGNLVSHSDPVASPDDTQRTAYYSYIPSRWGSMLSRIEDRWHRTITNLTWYADGRLNTYTEGDYDDANPPASTGEKYTYSYGGSTVNKSDSFGTKSYAPGVNGVANDATRRFDENGLVTQETGPAGNIIIYTYNARGNVATVAISDVTWTYTYDTNYPDQVASVVSNSPSQWGGWRYAYNTPSETPNGVLKSVSRIGSDGVAQVVASYVYDAKGHLIVAIDANGANTFYAYNAAGGATFVSNSGLSGPGTAYEYDSVGRVTKMTTPSGNATNYTYDADDRLKTISPPSPASVPALDFTTHISYDNYDSATGLVNVLTTDANGHATSRGYDGLGRLIRSVDALGNATQYSYQYNLLHSITDANGNVTSYDYNGNRYLTKTTFFDGAYETYSLSDAGGVTAVTDRKGTTAEYSYDTHGRLEYISYGTGSGVPYVSYQYIGQNLATVTDGRSTPAIYVSYTYDSQWRVATENESAGIVTYGYTTPGGDSVASYRVDPPFGQTGLTVTATMGYDSLARLSRIDWSPVTGGFTFAYNADGQYASMQFPNGQRRAFAYDNQGRLTSLANLDTHGGNLITYSYGYDYDWPTQSYTSLGNRTSVTITGSPSLVPNGVNKYSYDADQQLTSVTRLEGPTASYDYDPIGNRLHQVTSNGGNVQFTYLQNAAQKNTPRLMNVGGFNLTYDPNGNVTTGYTWDVANRLSAISTATIQYDGQNRRAAVNTPAPGPGLVKYVSIGLNTVGERSTTTARNNDYLFGPGIDEPLARRASDGTIQYYAVDGLGSVTALTSPTGQINRAMTYDEWGAVTSGAVDLFGYAGRELAQSATSLWNNRARYYAANWGRFLSEDPARIVGQGPYAYALNDPIINSDPLGLASGPAQAHVCCDGNGGFTICWDQTPVAGSDIEKCTLEHEQNHIKWFGCHPPYDQLCKGKKQGEKNFTLQSQADDNALECAGYEAQFKCMKKILPQLSGNQKANWWLGLSKLAQKAQKDFKCNTSAWQ
jgi:RHS repeat-associated protein